MDLPVSDPGPVKEGGPMFHCDNVDTELVHKTAQLLLPGLATACVDNTTGLFRGPSSVAVDIRKEMVDYLTQRSEMFTAETVVQGDGNPNQTEEVSDDPVEIITNFIDDFASSKRNWLSRVSGWLLSESREDKIDDFVQEMETNGFWFMDRRETVAGTLLKNVDYKNTSHCAMKFDSAEELTEHKPQCDFRPANCTNEGCHTKFCALHVEKHDAVCPYKVIPCEQKCSKSILRREMDRHCITVCPMKLVNCPFYQVGCQSTFPQCSLEQHCVEFLHSHLLPILQVIHKEDSSMEEIIQRVELLEKGESRDELVEALDVRSLTSAVKGLEAKMKKVEHNLEER